MPSANYGKTRSSWPACAADMATRPRERFPNGCTAGHPRATARGCSKRTRRVEAMIRRAAAPASARGADPGPHSGVPQLAGFGTCLRRQTQIQHHAPFDLAGLEVGEDLVDVGQRRGLDLRAYLALDR